VLKDLVRVVVSILNEYRGYSSEKLKKIAEPVAIIQVKADGLVHQGLSQEGARNE
jgi:hypothetical protein